MTNTCLLAFKNDKGSQNIFSSPDVRFSISLCIPLSSKIACDYPESNPAQKLIGKIIELAAMIILFEIWIQKLKKSSNSWILRHAF